MARIEEGHPMYEPVKAAFEKARPNRKSEPPARVDVFGTSFKWFRENDKVFFVEVPALSKFGAGYDASSFARPAVLTPPVQEETPPAEPTEPETKTPSLPEEDDEEDGDEE